MALLTPAPLVQVGPPVPVEALERLAGAERRAPKMPDLTRAMLLQEEAARVDPPARPDLRERIVARTPLLVAGAHRRPATTLTAHNVRPRVAAHPAIRHVRARLCRARLTTTWQTARSRDALGASAAAQERRGRVARTSRTARSPAVRTTHGFAPEQRMRVRPTRPKSRVSSNSAARGSNKLLPTSPHRRRCPSPERAKNSGSTGSARGPLRPVGGQRGGQLWWVDRDSNPGPTD